jgi:hypothetical protein
MESIQLRLLGEQDSLEALTALLHRAYAELGAMGFRYKAVDQAVEITRKRISSGECYVLICEAEIVGTAVLLPPSWRPAFCEWYARPEVAVSKRLAQRQPKRRSGAASSLIGSGAALCVRLTSPSPAARR